MPVPSVGFTGTRQGMTPSQEEMVQRLLVLVMKPLWVHHGDCVGSDEEFHNICKKLGLKVILHPPEDPKLRAFCDGYAKAREPKPYLDRDRDIVTESTVLIATPKEKKIVKGPTPRGSGTWYTINYAVEQGRRVYVVLPNGKVVDL